MKIKLAGVRLMEVGGAPPVATFRDGPDEATVPLSDDETARSLGGILFTDGCLVFEFGAEPEASVPVSVLRYLVDMAIGHAAEDRGWLTDLSDLCDKYEDLKREDDCK